MLPSSSSELGKYGQISHYKKFNWILQTQLANQESPCSTASTLCLGINGGTAMATMKEGKLISAAPQLLSNGDVNNSISGRPEIATPTNNRAIISPFCPTRALIIMNYNNNNSIEYPIIKTMNNSHALSLAVNCANSLNDSTDLNQRWVSPANNPQNPFPCATSECSTVEENYGSEASSSTLNQQINNTNFSTYSSTNESPRSVSRSCTLCGTTKTPLWRSGPYGPKSLCNACGIRMKKCRRLQASMEGGRGLPASHKATMLSTSGRSFKRPLNLVKVVKDGDFPAKLARLLNNRGRLTKVFAKDEETAAVLLMALSCGLVLA